MQITSGHILPEVGPLKAAARSLLANPLHYGRSRLVPRPVPVRRARVAIVSESCRQ